MSDDLVDTVKAEILKDPELLGQLQKGILGDQSFLRKLNEELDYARLSLVSVRENDSLAESIQNHLGLDLVQVERTEFEYDLERKCEILENVSGRDIFVISTIGDGQYPDVSLADTMRMIDALIPKAHSVSVVLPDFHYGAQDKTHSRREPRSAKLVAKELKEAGAKFILTVEPHSPQIESFEDGIEIMKAAPIFAHYIQTKYADTQGFVPASPDGGGIARRDEIIDNLDPLLVSGKSEYSGSRDTSQKYVKKEGLVNGDDVKDKDVIIFDDMLRSGKTMFHAAQAYHDAGARRIVCALAHMKNFGTEEFKEHLAASQIDELIVFNTRPEIEKIIQNDPVLNAKITVLDISPYLAWAIRNKQKGYTVRELVKYVDNVGVLYNSLQL